jgi:type IV pilus assembly protein PilM
VQIAAENPRRAYPPWASPPKKTKLGYPIDWLTVFRRVGITEDLVRPILVEHPGCLFAACGLALQGLQQAPIRLNLLPKENQTPLGRITTILNADPLSWVGRKRSPRNAWGLDLSASGLKAVKLAWEREEGGVVIEDFDVVSHDKMVDEAFSDDEAKTMVEETLNTFCSRHNVKADRICLGLPTRTLLTRRFTVPRADPKRLEKAIANEARRYIPVPLEQVAWDYQVMVGGDGEKASKREEEVLLVAARRPQLVDRLSALRNAGFRVDVVQSDCLALHNFLAYDHFGNDRGEGPSPPDAGRHIALLDVGSNQTHLVVSSPTSVWLRSSGCGGEQFTKALVRELQLTAAQAEELKRRPARAESMHRMYHALEPALEALIADARSMLDAFAASHPSQRIERVLDCGGSFRLHGLLRYLRSGF